MKKTQMLIAGCICLLVAGCADPMSGGSVAAATKYCLDAGGDPRYFHNVAETKFTCVQHGDKERR